VRILGWGVMAVALLFLAASSLGPALGQVLGPERTRECTVESITDVHKRRAVDSQVLRTTECGRIETPRASEVTVTGADCDWDIIQVGSRYRMTTVGLSFFLINQRLVGPVDLVEAAPGSRCMGDWLSDTGPVELDVPARPSAR
jgi:hypothetical protein